MLLSVCQMTVNSFSAVTPPPPPHGPVYILYIYIGPRTHDTSMVQELCESRGGRPGLSVLTSLLVSVDVKND